MPSSNPQQPLSAVLSEIIASEDAHVSLADLMGRFGGRAFGALLFVFGLACTLPLPPGGTTVFGLPMLVLAVQVAAGAATPWLPRGLRSREIPAASLRAGLARVLPWLKRAETVSRPRLAALFSPPGIRLIGAVCSVLAVVLILPIPLGNMLPGLAVTTLSFSLIQRDGLVALLGHAAAVLSAGVLALAAHIIVRAFQHIGALVTAA